MSGSLGAVNSRGGNNRQDGADTPPQDDDTTAEGLSFDAYTKEGKPAGRGPPAIGI